MPEAMERKLKEEADKKGLTGKQRNAWIYGTMRKTGWKPKQEQEKQAMYTPAFLMGYIKVASDPAIDALMAGVHVPSSITGNTNPAGQLEAPEENLMGPSKYLEPNPAGPLFTGQHAGSMVQSIEHMQNARNPAPASQSGFAARNEPLQPKNPFGTQLVRGVNQPGEQSTLDSPNTGTIAGGSNPYGNGAKPNWLDQNKGNLTAGGIGGLLGAGIGAVSDKKNRVRNALMGGLVGGGLGIGANLLNNHYGVIPSLKQ